MRTITVSGPLHPGESLHVSVRDRLIPLRRMLVALATGIALLVPGSYALAAPTDRLAGILLADDPALAAAAPETVAPAGILRTADGRTLWEREADDRRAMASTTKIMTALVVLDRADFGDVITVSAAAEAVGDAEIDLRAGQRVSVDTLFRAMLVPSANDAAYALAEYVAGTIPAFAQLMNEKARALGLQHSAFTNPTGLDADGHYTSASDLATLAAVAMGNERFAQAVGLSEITVEHASGERRVHESTNELLDVYDGIVGVKTGHTRAAGWCFVGAAERDGVGLTAVVLGTGSNEARFAEAQALLDWGFEHYALTQVSSAESTAALVPVSDFLDVTVAAVVSDSVSVPVFDLDGEVTARADVLSSAEAPIAAGQRLGTLTVSQGDRLLAQVPLVAAADVPRPDAFEAVGIWLTRLWRAAFGGAVAAEPVLMM